MSQSEDAYAALKQWYERFPDFKTNDLFVSGESYGGVYVPYLSYQIYINQDADHIPLKGFLVGNGATDWDFDVGPSYPQTLYNFNMISKKTYDKYENDECVVYFNGVRNTTGKNATDCEAQMDYLMSDAIDGLNWYDLYRPNDPELSEEEKWGTTVIGGVEKKYKRGYTMGEYLRFIKRPFSGSDRVQGAFLHDYLNKEEVQEALHIPKEYNITYYQCSGEVGGLYILNATAETSPSVWIYPILQKAGIRMMFYSGDTDGAVTTYGSKQWINKLDFCVTADWKAWYNEG